MERPNAQVVSVKGKWIGTFLLVTSVLFILLLILFKWDHPLGVGDIIKSFVATSILGLVVVYFRSSSRKLRLGMCCTRCGKETNQTDTFCSNCGNKNEKITTEIQVVSYKLDLSWRNNIRALFIITMALLGILITKAIIRQIMN